MTCRGIRGAITVEANEADAILKATHALLEAMVAANEFEIDDLHAAIEAYSQRKRRFGGLPDEV